MLSVQDRNYVNLLLTITEPIMEESIERPLVQDCQRTRRIYDELQSLWFCVLLNPDLNHSTKTRLVSYMSKWHQKPKCPKENADDLDSKFLLQAIATSEAISKLLYIRCLL